VLTHSLSRQALRSKNEDEFCRWSGEGPPAAPFVAFQPILHPFLSISGLSSPHYDASSEALSRSSGHTVVAVVVVVDVVRRLMCVFNLEMMRRAAVKNQNCDRGEAEMIDVRDRIPVEAEENDDDYDGGVAGREAAGGKVVFIWERERRERGFSPLSCEQMRALRWRALHSPNDARETSSFVGSALKRKLLQDLSFFVFKSTSNLGYYPLEIGPSLRKRGVCIVFRHAHTRASERRRVLENRVNSISSPAFCLADKGNRGGRRRKSSVSAPAILYS